MDGTVGAHEATAQLSALLERVARGESLTITRDGRPVARLVPVGTPPAQTGRVSDSLRARRETLRAEGVKPFPIEEIIDLIRSGRKA